MVADINDSDIEHLQREMARIGQYYNAILLCTVSKNLMSFSPSFT